MWPLLQMFNNTQIGCSDLHFILGYLLSSVQYDKNASSTNKVRDSPLVNYTFNWIPQKSCFADECLYGSDDNNNKTVNIEYDFKKQCSRNMAKWEILHVFCKQLDSGFSPESCLYFQDFWASKLLNECLVVWPIHQYLQGILQISWFRINIYDQWF